MITETDEQIKEYSIWSSQQQELIEETIQKLSLINRRKYKSVSITKFVVTPNPGEPVEPMRYIGFEDVLLSQIFHTLETPKHYLQDIILKTVSEGLMNARKDVLLFDVLTPEDITTNQLII